MILSSLSFGNGDRRTAELNTHVTYWHCAVRGKCLLTERVKLFVQTQVRLMSRLLFILFHNARHVI